MTRRDFLQKTAAAALALPGSWPARGTAADLPERKFALCLSPGTIHVKADPFEAIRLARQHGYEAVAPTAGELARLSPEDLDRLAAEMKAGGLAWGAAVISPFFDADDARFKDRIEKALPLLRALQRAGATRSFTWTGPSSNALTYRANFQLHLRRTREMGKVMADHGVRLGIEYIGTRTVTVRGKFPFIRTLPETKELADEVGLPNVGLCLDSWHWFQAGDREEDILKLANRDVVCADICDAPAGVPRDQMPDSPRKLPCTTGVIDLKAFLRGLLRIGYDGPVGTEPFDDSLQGKSNEENLLAATAAMKKAFALVE